MKIQLIAMFLAVFAAGGVACGAAAQVDDVGSNAQAATVDGGADASHAADAALGDAQVDAAVPSVAFSAIFPLLAERCSGCHFGSFPQGDLDFGATKDDAYATLVGKAAGQGACGGTGQILVTPGSPETSLLYTKLAGTQNCGSAMPRGRNAIPFTAAELASVSSWIAGGAKND